MNIMHRRALARLAMLAAIVALPAAQARADVDPVKERATAAMHAGLAAAAKDMKTTQMHLHHVVNCLVGPSGKGFDANEANPCKDQGMGAIPDTKDAGQKKILRQALAKANAGLKATSMDTAQKNASQAQALLTPKTM
jgi:hypothetical protein